MKKNKNSSQVLRITLWLGVSIFVVIRASSIVSSIGNFMKTLEPIYQHPFATTSEKMSMKYPRYYDLIESIKNQTDEHSTIYIPEVNIAYGAPMWALGHQQITQTLLYPRTVKVYTGVETFGYLVFITETNQGVIALK